MTVRPFFPRPWQLRAALDGRLSAVAVPLDPQPEPWKDYHLEGGCMTSDWSFEVGQYTEDGKRFKFGLWMHCRFHESRFQPLPFAPGDLLVCKEAYIIGKAVGGYAPGVDPDANPDGPTVDVIYRATHDGPAGPWSSPVTMPRWASRMTWEVSSVRVCRAQDVTEEEAWACGLEQWATVGDARTSGGLAWGEIPEDASDDAIFWVADYDSALSEDSDRAVTLDPREAFRARWTADHGPDAWERNPWVQIARVTVHNCNIDRLEDVA